MIETYCVADGCPVKSDCRRYISQRNRYISRYIKPPAEHYEPDGCKEFIEFVFPTDLPKNPING